MSCEKWEPLIALWAGEDLSEAESRAVSSHVQSCSTCGALARELRENQISLRELREEDLASMAAEVRAGVMTRAGRPAPGAWWRYAWMAAAAALVVLAAMIWRSPSAAPPLPSVPEQIAHHDTSGDSGQANRLPHHTHARTYMRPRVKRRQAEPLVVKMLTDDPDVVIYWIVEEKGD